MQKEQAAQDYGTNCKNCERYKTLGDVCVIEHGKKFLWEYCRDFAAEVVLPDYKDLMRTVKAEQVAERHKAREKKERERKKRLKERMEKIELKKKERRARLRRIREKKKLKQRSVRPADQEIKASPKLPKADRSTKKSRSQSMRKNEQSIE